MCVGVWVGGCVRDVMVIFVGNGRIQIPGDFECISHSVNIFGKGIHPTIFPLFMDK